MKSQKLFIMASVLMAVGVSASAQSYWSMNGNSATSTNFLGTTNDAPFRIKTNGYTRMTFSGYKAGIGIDYPTACPLAR